MNMYEDIAIWSQKFTVTHYFVDPDGFASIHGLAFFLQEVAHNHASARSLGFEDLIRDNKAWVLTRQAIKLYSIPVIGEDITVESWVENTTQSYSVRDFHILDSSGKVAVIARTSWMMIDVIQRRPVKIPGDVLQKIPLTPGKLEEDLALDKLPVVTAESGLESFPVRYSDLDMNNHVNNITYVRWIMDGFDAGFRSKNRLGSLEINYLNEALYGNRLLTGHLKDKNNNEYFTIIRNEANNREIAVARTIWKDKSLKLT
jgi:medium-chain acyl-[acyl-carrier-protein] hydrolase